MWFRLPLIKLSVANDLELKCSYIIIGNFQLNAVKRARDHELARQAAIQTTIYRAFEHAIFEIVHWFEFLDPRVRHITVACRTRACTATFGINARDAVLHRCFHHWQAIDSIDFMTTALAINKYNFRQSFSPWS